MIEVIVMIAVIAVVVSFLFSARPRPNDISRIKCVSNLKCVALATRVWTADHGEMLPWAVSTNKGGTLELADSTNLWLHWYAVRRELESPRSLICPSDIDRRSTNRVFAEIPQQLTSYFINFSAIPETTNSILAGDRNLVGDEGRLRAGWHNVATSSRVAWDSDMHRSVGNLAKADGSVQQTPSGMLQIAFRSSPVSTNRLLIP